MMASSEWFTISNQNRDYYWADKSCRQLVAIKDPSFGRKSVYGTVPMLCDGEHEGVHQFEIKIEEGDGSIVIGIDEGRTNELRLFHMGRSTHYAMSSGGRSFVAGVLTRMIFTFHSYVKYAFVWLRQECKTFTPTAANIKMATS